MDITWADDRPGRGDDGPEGHLDRLLGRAENADSLDDATLAPLRTALMHRTELHALRRRKAPPGTLAQRTLKHVFLLADGGSAVLWETEYVEAPGARPRHQVFADRRAVEAVEARMRAEFGEASPARPAFGRVAGADALPGEPLGESALGVRRSAPPYDPEAADSADHARRVLRRAENAAGWADRVRALLRSAVRHRTTLVTMRHGGGDEFLVEWSLYEHAFRLADGAELSLWEVEHSLPRDKCPVCEVYLDEAAARDSADRHRPPL